MFALLRPLARIPPVAWLWLTLAAVVISRVMIVSATPQYGELIDLSIYREAGKLVVNGLDPYDFDSDRSLREQMRLDGEGADAYVSATQERYDHFVSSNLPGSTLLFALIEWLSGGSPLGWRLWLVLGDLLMVLGAYLLCVRAGLDLRRVEHKLGFFSLLAVYPSLLMWGTLIPEDKQFQIAFMLFTAALLLPGSAQANRALRPPGRMTDVARGAALGAALALSILFKALGAVLLPAVARGLASRPRREWLGFGVAFAVVVALLVAPFSTSFVALIGKRLHTGSIEEAQHGSPWALLPWQTAVAYLRPLAVAGALWLVVSAFLAKKIDLLNALAALLVTFICLWITNGSMDRLNITMIFASFCLASTAPERWWKLALANTLFQGLTYVAAIALRGANSDAIEVGDGVNTAFFVLGYFGLLARPRAEPAVQAVPAAL